MPALTNPSTLSLSGDGKTLYVSGHYSDTLEVFDRDQTTGGLAYTGCLRGDDRSEV